MRTFRKLSWMALAFFLTPLMAEAHSMGGAMNGWNNGFNHPLCGWDHLVVMIAVGIWAAQQRGRAMWLIPLTFVGVMTIGGICGTLDFSLPGGGTGHHLVGCGVRGVGLSTCAPAPWLGRGSRRFFRLFPRVCPRSGNASLGQLGHIRPRLCDRHAPFALHWFTACAADCVGTPLRCWYIGLRAINHPRCADNRHFYQ